MADQTPSAASSLGTVGGHYKLLSKLGEGAFGEVYRAQHELLEQEFAVKILKPELCEDQQVRDRFLDEARALIRFSHANVVQLRHVGENEGRLYLVMDFVRGEPLNDVMRREAPFDEKRAVALIDQVLQGLAAAHAVGIVHRDLKPSNVLVEKKSDGTEKLHILDFGLSKLNAFGEGMKSAHRSVSGSIIGTLAYMSPEQIQGQTVDQRSDVFAAGLVLMEMLQGHHPYPGESGIMVAARLLRDPIPPLDAKVAAKISPTVRSALSTALERDRDARFPSATAFASALQGKGPPSDTSKVTTIEQARQDLARAEAKAALEKAHQQIERKKKGGLVAVLLVSLLAAGAGWWFFLGPGKQPASEGPGGAGGGTAVATNPSRPRNPDAGPTQLPSPAPTPAPKEPEPAPAPAPAPKEPEPAPSPTPKQPEPPAPTPKQPDPAPGPAPAPQEPDPAPAPAPKQPEPAAAPKPPDPAPTPAPAPKEPEPAPTTPPPSKPPEVPPTPPAPAPKSAEELAKAGDAAFAQGRWAEAKAAYRESLGKDVAQIPVLRGAAAAALTEADVLARSGRLPEAQQALAETVAWLGTQYKVYEDARPTDFDEATLTRLRGFGRLYRAQAHSERMRWYTVAGDAAAAAKERKAAEDDFEIAWQFLQRDSVPYWEFLIRRAEHRFLLGDATKALEDLAITTQTKNTSVPAHMWLAHLRGVRRVIDSFLARGNPANAVGWTSSALEIAKNGLAWQENAFTQDQWHEWVRVMWLAGTLQTSTTDLTPTESLLRFWVGEAAKKPAAPWQRPEVTKSKILAAQAALGTAQARLARANKKEPDATAKAAAAEKSAREAVALAEAAAKDGGPLPAAFPYRVLADALRLQGKTEEAAQAEKSASAAGLKNPD